MTVIAVYENGVLRPQEPLALEEGAVVTLTLNGDVVTLGLQPEFESWDRAGDEAWAMIDEWEMEAKP